MSRIGKKTISVPEKVSIAVEGNELVAKGPLGEVRKKISPKVKLEVDGSSVRIVPATDGADRSAIWGTFGSHLSNMLEGVSKGYQKKLLIEGVGFRAEISGTTLTMLLGFSHPVKMTIPKGIKASVEKGVISVSGADKEAVGQFAASIRANKPPEPYKGKGIRYEDEVVRRKQGKKTA